MPVRVGVIGAGHWATEAHLPALSENPDAALVAIADPDDQNRRRAAARFHVPAVYEDHRELLANEELDAVIVAVPHASHFPVAAAAIQEGLHVLIEKPMVLEPGHGWELMRLAARNRVEIVVGYPWHFNEQSLLARAWILRGRLGELQFVQCLFASTALELYRGRPDRYPELYGEGDDAHMPLSETYSDPRVVGGGQGQTQVTHSAALLFFLTDLVPSSVFAFMANAGLEVDVADAIAVRFDGGCLGTIGSTGAVVPRRAGDLLEYRVYGSEGHLRFDVQDGVLERFDEDGTIERPPVLAAASRYPQRAPAQNLVDVALGRASNGSPPLIGVRTVAFLKAAYASASRGVVTAVEGRGG